jgi:hypothetical protein
MQTDPSANRCLRWLYQVPKEPGRLLEDRVASRRIPARFCLCDGASTSYAARAWASTLAKHYAKYGSVNLAWLQSARQAFLRRFDIAALDFIDSIAFDRGSFSTLLGIELIAFRRREALLLNATCVGDSFLVISDGKRIVLSRPDPDAFNFSANPILLASHPNKGVLRDDDDEIVAHTATHEIDLLGEIEAPLILMMSDALAEWIVHASAETLEQRLAKLLVLKSLSYGDATARFADLVAVERSAGRLRYDDTTLLLVEPQ